jgi:alanyl-tRNA synthetase
VLAALLGERVAFTVNVTPDLVNLGLNAGKIAATVGQLLGGKGGGRPDSAQGGGKDRDQLPAALNLVAESIQESLR